MNVGPDGVVRTGVGEGATWTVPFSVLLTTAADNWGFCVGLLVVVERLFGAFDWLPNSCSHLKNGRKIVSTIHEHQITAPKALNATPNQSN